MLSGMMNSSQESQPADPDQYHIESNSQTDNQILWSFLDITQPTVNMLKYDVLHYEINLELDFNTESISGYGKVTLKSTADNISFIDLNLGNHLTVTQVLMNDTINLNYEHLDDHILKSYLNETIDSGDQISLMVYYSGFPSNSPYLKSMHFYEELGSHVCYTHTEPYGSRFWYPCKDFPFDKADSIDVIVTHPDNYTAVSNGLMQSRVDNGDGTATTHWHSGYPIATYLITIGCTDYELYSQPWEYSPGDTLSIDHYYYPGASPEISWSSIHAMIDYTIPALETFTYWFGQYPFIDERYGHNHYGSSGMEHQTMTSIGPARNEEMLIVHECAHHWCGNKITCENFHHVWLNEGFATYAECLYQLYHYGEDSYRDLLDYYKFYDVWKLYLDNINFYHINNGIYFKGCWVMYMLHMILGDDGFRQAMHQYFNDPELAYGTAITDDLEIICEEVYGAPMDWFFDQWLYQDGNPDYYFSYIFEPNPETENYTIFVAIDQKKEWETFIMPVEIRAHTSGYDSTITVFNDERSELFAFDFPGVPDSIQIDPEEKILCQVCYEDEFTAHIVSEDPDDGYVGVPYFYEFKAVGGTPPYNWSLINGRVPYGTDFHGGSSAYINGIPTSASEFLFTLRAVDSSVPPQESEQTFTLKVLPAAPMCGDLDYDQAVNVNDIVLLINYIYLDGDVPDPIEIGDVNCDGKIRLVDVIYIVNYVFRDGLEPCHDCP